MLRKRFRQLTTLTTLLTIKKKIKQNFDENMVIQGWQLLTLILIIKKELKATLTKLKWHKKNYERQVSHHQQIQNQNQSTVTSRAIT